MKPRNESTFPYTTRNQNSTMGLSPTQKYQHILETLLLQSPPTPMLHPLACLAQPPISPRKSQVRGRFNECETKTLVSSDALTDNHTKKRNRDGFPSQKAPISIYWNQLYFLHFSAVASTFMAFLVSPLELPHLVSIWWEDAPHARTTQDWPFSCHHCRDTYHFLSCSGDLLWFNSSYRCLFSISLHPICFTSFFFQSSFAPQSYHPRAKFSLSPRNHPNSEKHIITIKNKSGIAINSC